jgi:hypothetical protein
MSKHNLKNPLTYYSASIIYLYSTPFKHNILDIQEKSSHWNAMPFFFGLFCLEADTLHILSVGLRLHADWGADNVVWKIEGVYEFASHQPYLVTEVDYQFTDSLQAKRGSLGPGSGLKVELKLDIC